jgi:hypothetical protein
MRKELVEKLVVSEINNFRRISGLPLLNEGGKSDIARGAIRLIDDVFGITSKSLDKLSSEVGADAARLLKKLTDPNDSTPIMTIIDDLMSVNKAVGRNVYTQLRNHLDTIVDSSGKSLKEKLDEIGSNSKQMIEDGSTVDVAAEYFDTEIKRILDDSTNDDELISAISKYEKDVNRDWFPSSRTSRTSDATSSSADEWVTETTPRLMDLSLDELTRRMSQEDADEIFALFSKKSNWQKIKLYTTNLLKKVKNMLDRGKVLEDETMNLITSLRKTEKVPLEDEIIKQIIKNVGELKDINTKTYKTLTNWIEKYMKKSSDRGVRELYNKLTTDEGWNKVVESIPLFNRFLQGFGNGLIEFGESSKNLRRAWLKVPANLVTLPLSVIKRVFTDTKEFKFLFSLSEAEKTAFKKWLATGSPDSWGSISPKVTQLGKAGKIGAGSAQLLRRYLSVKFILAISQAAIASGLKFFELDDELDNYPVLKQYFGTKELAREGALNFWANVWDKAWNSSYGFAIPAWTFGRAILWDIPNLMDASTWEETSSAAQAEIEKIDFTPSGTTEQTLELTLDAVKSAAPNDTVKGALWQLGDDILIATINSDGEDIDYKVTVEDNEYMVELGPPHGKIKLSDYYKN